MVKIRYYKESDYEDVEKILKEGDLFDPAWENRENLSRKIKRDSQSILIAEDDEKVVGCVFIVEDGWNGFVWRLCVKKSYRKKGIGVSLMQRAEEIIKERGIKEASIFVDPKNQDLQDWYKKQKYEKGRDWTFMFKKLNK